MSKRNLIAKDLRTSKYRKRIVAAKKGKGSYKRKGRFGTNPDRPFYYLRKLGRIAPKIKITIAEIANRFVNIALIL